MNGATDSLNGAGLLDINSRGVAIHGFVTYGCSQALPHISKSLCNFADFYNVGGGGGGEW